MSKTWLYHARALIPLCILLLLFNILYAMARLPYPALFGAVLMLWWRVGLLRVFAGLPGAVSVPLAIKGLIMALLWPMTAR